MGGLSNSNLVSHSSRAWKFKMKVLEKLVSPSFFSAPAAESHLLTALLSHIHPFPVHTFSVVSCCISNLLFLQGQ